MKRFYTILVIIIIICLSLIIASRRERVYLQAESDDGKYIATIIWKKQMVLLEGVDAWLVVKEKKNDFEILRRWLMNDDVVSGIKNEITDLYWINYDVYLTIDRQRSDAPEKYQIEI